MGCRVSLLSWLKTDYMHAYADDFTLLAVVRKPADRPILLLPPLTGTGKVSGVVQSLEHDTES